MSIDKHAAQRGRHFDSIGYDASSLYMYINNGGQDAGNAVYGLLPVAGLMPVAIVLVQRCEPELPM